MELTPRLKKIASLVPSGTHTVADIGTDHAYLPVYCILNGIADSAVAMDVNSGPLARARESAEKFNLSDKITLRLSDGINELEKGEADVIVIAGMGGLLIKRILEEGKNKILPGTLLLLQPMIAQRELREYLFSDGYCIENEYVVSEGNKFYNIFAVRYGVKSEFDENDTIIGRNLRKNSPDVFEKYAGYKIRILNKIISGMEKSASLNNADDVKHELEIFLKELERSRCDES